MVLGECARTVGAVRPTASDPVLTPHRRARDMATAALVATLVGPDTEPGREHRRIAELIDAGSGSLSSASPDELSMLAGISHAWARVLAAAFELSHRVTSPARPCVLRGPADAAAIALRELANLSRERVIVIVCDAANRPVRNVVVSDGAIDRSLMPVREILNAALRWDGRAFAVAHNHPCGDPTPSDADAVATRLIGDAARVVGLRFLGHVVIGGGRWMDVVN